MLGIEAQLGRSLGTDRHGVGAARGEAAALRQVFGSRVSQVPVVSAKPLMGNTGAGAGSLEELMDRLLQQAKAGENLDVHAKVLEAVEEQLFRKAYALAEGNQALASRWLQVSRQTMREKLQKFGVRES